MFLFKFLFMFLFKIQYSFLTVPSNRIHNRTGGVAVKPNEVVITVRTSIISEIIGVFTIWYYD